MSILSLWTVMNPESNKKYKGLIVAGMNSSDGKTLVTCMLLSALERRKISVQPFKIGPDYIDPGYHSFVSSKISLNLDPWIMEKKLVEKEAKKFTENAFGLAEGVMGLFDGFDKKSDAGSSMEVSRWLGWPIILVVPCSNAGRSIIASIQGFIEEAGGERFFAGIILNKVNNKSHGEYLFDSCSSLKIPVIGILPETFKMRWEERHLGLKPVLEQKYIKKNELADFAEKHINLELITKFFSLKSESTKFSKKQVRNISTGIKKIALAHDEAFHFYYEANFSWLKEKFVDIIKFSPLHDSQVPKNVDAIILGGGFPEVFAEKLSFNKKMMISLKKTIESGILCYAECGGLMILSEGIRLNSGKFLSMVGVVPGNIEMTKQLQNFGYCKIKLPKYGEIRGHEFHYSRWLGELNNANLWDVTKNSTGTFRKEGFSLKNLHASYVHLYFPQASKFISDFFGLSK